MTEPLSAGHLREPATYHDADDDIKQKATAFAMIFASKGDRLVAQGLVGQAMSHERVRAYDRGRRDVLNAILSVNPGVARKLHDIRGEDTEFTNVHGKLPFDVVFWVTSVAEQLGIEPKESASD